MGERTAEEKASFGKVKVQDGVTNQLTESNIEWIIDQYEKD